MRSFKESPGIKLVWPTATRYGLTTLNLPGHDGRSYRSVGRIKTLLRSSTRALKIVAVKVLLFMTLATLGILLSRHWAGGQITAQPSEPQPPETD
jgi:hypothetical protein